MDENELSALVSDLIGMPLWKIIIGPSGIMLDFGKKLEVKIGNTPTVEGELTLWIQCGTRIIETTKEGDKEILRSYFPQDEEEETIYKKYLEGKVVTKALIGRQNKALILKIDQNIIFTAPPFTKESELRWIIYDHRIKNPPGIVVYTDGIELAV